jgi:hypothetical protein
VNVTEKKHKLTKVMEIMLVLITVQKYVKSCFACTCVSY